MDFCSQNIFFQTYSFRNVFMYKEVKICHAICYNHLANIGENIIDIPIIGLCFRKQEHITNLAAEKGLITGFHPALMSFLLPSQYLEPSLKEVVCLLNDIKSLKVSLYILIITMTALFCHWTLKTPF